MKLSHNYTPSPKQSMFHQSTAFETLYGGAAGGGKSTAIVGEAITLALNHAGIRIYVFRRTIPELKESIVPEIYKQAGELEQGGLMQYHGVDRQFSFFNDSIIQLAYLKDPKDRYRYQSAEIHALLIDELTHFLQDDYEYLKTRVRSDMDVPLKVMAATNPGGRGHGWVKTRFIDPSPPYKVFESDGETVQYIPATLNDHPSKAFRDAYRKRLEATQDEALRRALLEGDWDVFSGQVFNEWRRAKHVVDPFEIPGHWRRWMAYDPGFVNPAALWFTRDPTTDRTYIYREYYKKNQSTEAQMEDFRQLEGGENIDMRFSGIDLFSSVADKASSGDTFQKQFAKGGFHFQRAVTDRLAGKNAWHSALAVKGDGKPGLQVFSNCLNVIGVIPSLVYSPTRPEDVDKHEDDHLYDAGRYGLIANTPKRKPRVHTPPHIMQRKRNNQ